ncbi:MAG: hypothetical protein V2A76_00960, partial [Planctomycetota bacterium]
ATAETITWQPPGEEPGEAVSVGALGVGQGVEVFGGGDSLEQRGKWLYLQRTVASLPGSDTVDDVSLDFVPGAILARITGAEAAAGITLYRPFGFRNINIGDGCEGVRLYCADPFRGAAQTTLAASMGVGADTLEASSLAKWGPCGWVYNVTKGDGRYFYDRSGDKAMVLNPGGGQRGFVAAAWDAGDLVEPYPWVDLGLDAPDGGNHFENPATRETAPAGVAFSCPRSAGGGAWVGTLAAQAYSAAWLRLEIPAGARPLERGLVDVRVYYEVPV